MTGDGRRRRFTVLVSGILLSTWLGGCTSAAGPAGSGETEPDATAAFADRLDRLFSDELEVVDLTHALSPDTVYWPSPSGNPFEYEVVRAQPSGASAMGAYSTPEHHGTHLDAPIHGGDNLATVDRLTPDDLLGPAVVIDVSEQAAADADFAVTREDLLAWEGSHGRIPDGAIVLMYSGWSEKYDDPDAYKNQDSDGRMHFPGFSEGAARFLIDEREISGIGVDTLSVDPGVTRGLPAHGIVNGSGKFHLENVANVHLLPEAGAYLIVAPIKIEGGSGGQVRIFAVLP